MNYATVFSAYRIAAHRALRMGLAVTQIENLLQATAGGIRTDVNEWAAHVTVASNAYLGPSLVRAARQAQTFSVWLHKRLTRLDELRAQAREKREAGK